MAISCSLFAQCGARSVLGGRRVWQICKAPAVAPMVAPVRVRRPSPVLGRTFSRGADSRPRTGNSRAGAADAVDERELSARRGFSRFRCVTEAQTPFNRIVILEAPKRSTSRFAGCRLLLLDHSGNVHSVYNRESAWTDSYWLGSGFAETDLFVHSSARNDEFASLPAIIPPGPVAILGLAGGTTARLLLQLWPSLKIEGFEIDEMLVDEARLHLGLAELEVPTTEGGCVTVHVEDAFSSSAAVEGGFAGIIVDLFSEGGIPVELQQRQTWLTLRNKLRVGGRLMVNCGGICVEKADAESDVDDGTWTWVDGGAIKDATLAAMAVAFRGQCSWRTTETEDSANCLALSGPLPDLQSWAAAVPEQLKEGVLAWKPFK